MSRLLKTILALEARIGELERVNASFIREGVIVEADPSKNEYVVDASGVKTNPIPFSRMAGDVVEHVSGKVGQRVIVLSPNGDMKRAIVLPGGYTDDTPQPDTDSEAYFVMAGGASMKLTGDGLVIRSGSTTVTISAAGLDVDGGHVRNDGTTIDKTHKHDGVLPGSSQSGEPV